MNRVVYVPAAVPAQQQQQQQQPLAHRKNTTKQKYTKVNLLAHASTTIRYRSKETIYGIVFAWGIQYYKGICWALVYQSFLLLIELWDDVLVRVLLLRGPNALADPNIRIFDEKVSLYELDTSKDEIVDDKGNPVVIQNIISSSTGATSSSSTAV